MPTLELTDDEASIIETMRNWDDGNPPARAVDWRDGIYLRLLHARAEILVMAIRHSYNDVDRRRESMMSMVSPFVVMDLVSAWLRLNDRERDDETSELEAQG